MKLKRIALIPLFVLMIIVLTGCKYEYEFEQDLENVESVEIKRFDYETQSTTAITTLDDNSAICMLNDFSSTSCRKHFGDHSRDYGRIIVYINYKNGEAEILGDYLSGYVDSTGKIHEKIQYFGGSDFCNIVLKYVDEDLVPELVSEYPEITSKP